MADTIHKSRYTLIALAFFGVAMGVFEAIVVVYLRQIYYPQGFEFPLTMLSQHMVLVECLREVSTIVMLAAVGAVAGKNILQKLSYFFYCFGIWDIFYYVFLKLLLNWPSSLLTWDILFLIPVPWAGPVLAPVICSLTMILFAGAVLFLQDKGRVVTIKPIELVISLLGALAILGTFMADYFGIIIRESFASGAGTMAAKEHLAATLANYTPTHYNWWVFIIGEILILSAMGMAYRRIISGKNNEVKK